MDRHDYHFISLKFLTAIIMALFFAFLLTYVFSPVNFDYQVYSFKKENIAQFSDSDFFKADSGSDFKLDLAAKNKFQTELKQRSFELMEASQPAVLTVVTGNYLEEVNNLKKDEDLALNKLRLELEAEQERLLQSRRNKLEKDLAAKLQKLRHQVKEKYSDYSQRQIRDNYLEMINLKIGIEVLAQDEAEKEYYSQKMEELEKKQQKLLTAKSELINEDISEQTRTLILDFNRKYSQYRQKLRNDFQKEIALKRDQMQMSLSRKRQEIRDTLKSRRKQRSSEIKELITKSKKYY